MFSKNIPGEENVIDNSLSRDFHLTEKEFLDLLHNNLSHNQVPDRLKIFNLPTETTSWLSSLGEYETKKSVFPGLQHQSKLATSISGSNLPDIQGCKMYGLNHTIKNRRTTSCQTSSMVSEKISLEKLKNPNWWDVQLRPPCQKWCHSSIKI